MNQQIKIGIALAILLLGVLMTSSTAPRGIRNNNPGNLRRTADRWQGLAAVQTDPEFFQFADPVSGIRAMTRVLINYQERHGLRTIRELITRWAPPVGQDSQGRAYTQNTAAYIDSIAQAVGAQADMAISVPEVAARLIPAMIRHENGQQPYDVPTLAAGITAGGGLWA